MKTCCLYIVAFMILTDYLKNVHGSPEKIPRLKVSFLEFGSEIQYVPEKSVIGFRNTDLRIYCYRGRPKNIVHIWQSVDLKIIMENDNFEQYEGHSPEIVYNEHKAHRESWSFNLFTNKKTVVHLNPFNQSCVGIDTSEEYLLTLNSLRIDFWKFLLLLVGTFLFYSATKLSNNSLFYYICGVTFGISASFMIIIYMFSKLLPKKPVMYGFLVGGWTVAVYFFQIIWENIRIIAVDYKTYILWYIGLSGLISFLICYRMGPIQNPRNKNIIKWTLQCAGMLMIAFHSYYQEASVAICLIMVLSKYFPTAIVAKSKRMWRRRFPPKPELLSSEDYYAQGVTETCKGLQELREFCSSPECKQWRTILKLKDANRFASFIEGSSHLSDQEIIDYESSDELSFRSKRKNVQKKKVFNGNSSLGNGDMRPRTLHHDITDDSSSESC